MRRALVCVFLLIGVIWYAYDAGVTQAPDSRPSDFAIYRLAAERIVHGQSPYAEPGYIYPPLLAYLLLPFTRTDYLAARWIWFLFGHACLLTAAWLIWRKLGRGAAAGCIVVLVWAGGRAAGDDLALGQVQVELTLLLAAAYCAVSDGAGVWIGMASAVKILPGVTLIPMLLARMWRRAVITVAAAILLLAAPWAYTTVFLSGPKAPHTDFSAGTPMVLNWSMPAVALRIADPQPAYGPVPKAWSDASILERLQPSRKQRFIGIGTCLAVFVAGVLALLAVSRGRLTIAQIPLAMAATVTLALVASPVSWCHYQTLDYPGVALLLGQIAARKAWARFAFATGLAALLYPIPVQVLRLLFHYHHHEYWPHSALTMYLWTSCAAAAGLATYGLMLAELRITSRAASSQSS